MLTYVHRSYTVELEDGSRRIFHANKLRKFNVRVESVICDSLIEELEPVTVNSCAVVYENDEDFGQLSMIPLCGQSAPFGLNGTGNSFVRALSNILRPIREFSDSFVDDIAVHSDEWTPATCSATCSADHV